MTTVEAVFGPDLAQSSAEDAARHSPLQFVRGRSELGIFDAARNPTGHVLTAWEAYHAYGLPILEEAVEYGSAILNHPIGIEPTISSRIQTLGLKPSAVANESGLTKQTVDKSARPNADNDVGDLERIAFILGLDELQLGYRPTGTADSDLAVRLKTLQRPATANSPRLSPSAVLTFSHAASVIRTQRRLQRWLGIKGLSEQFEPTDYYGTAVSPAYKIGYELAERAREDLCLNDRPIDSMRQLVENELGIPVIQTKLPTNISGATLAVSDPDHGEARGIVLNTAGANRNVWVRRATLAHELGHLLFDPIQQLERVRVDTYQSSQVDPQVHTTDRVEQRANAFAIAFLAPMEVVRDMAPTPVQADAVRKVMSTFGISHTAAGYHIRNAHYRQFDLPDNQRSAAPSHEQEAAENFATDYFPIRTTPEMRVGRFIGIVASCFDKGYISDDSAAKYVNCSKDQFIANLDVMRGLYDLN